MPKEYKPSPFPRHQEVEPRPAWAPSEGDQHERLRAKAKAEYEKLLGMIREGLVDEREPFVKECLQDLERTRELWGIKLDLPPRGVA